MKKAIIYIFTFFTICSCSTTRHIPAEEQLYTGIKEIEIVGKKEYASTAEGATAIEEITAALDCPPNASIAGSSTLRGIPIGLWLYNSFYNSDSKVGRWIFNTFAQTPVLISKVNPELRARVATNILSYYGYFNGGASAEVINNSKNSKKAKVAYKITLNEPYTYDSIAYLNFPKGIDSLLIATKSRSLLKKGAQFSVMNLNGERERINNMLRNRGYYYSQTNYINFLADTISTPGKVSLRVEPQKDFTKKVEHPWRIGNTTLNIIDNRGSNNRKRAENDTITIRSLTYIYSGKKPPVKAGAILSNTFLRKGQLYSQDRQQLSLQRLSLLNIFNSINFAFTPREDSDTLDMSITAQLGKPYDFAFELNATSKSNSQIGPGTKISLSRNNIFRGGETFKLSLQGSYEWQTDKRLQGKQSVINSWEIGADASLSFPRLFFPILHRRYLRFPATTLIRLYADQMNRSGFFRMVHFGGEISYKIYERRNITHGVIPFRLTYDMLQSTTAKFDSIAANNRSIANSFRNQFIPAMQYTFTYDNAKSRNRHKSWVELSATSSGNITSLIFLACGEGWNKKNKEIFNNPYAQFAKLTVETRQLFELTKKSHIATRFFIGAIKSYGNSTTAPYSEQFYIGGANSLRAFTVRSIGPGSYHPKKDSRYSYLDETGTFKMEANIEYRFPIFGDIYGALFVDAGNVWLLEKDESRPGGEFRFDSFAKQIALNTGAGVRYDLEFLVLRLDFGIAIHAPYDTGKKGYYNIPSFGKGFAWHFAIGYPF